MTEMEGVDLDLELSSLKFTADDEELLDAHHPPPDADAATEEPAAAESSVARPVVTWHEESKNDTKTSPVSSSASSPPSPKRIATAIAASAASTTPSTETKAATAAVSDESTSSSASNSLRVSQSEPAASAPSSTVTPAAAAAAAAPTSSVETAVATAPAAFDSAVTDSPARSASSSLSTTQPGHRSRASIIDFAAGRSKVNLSALSLQPEEYLRMFRAVLSLQRKCRQWRVRIKEKMRQRVVEERLRQEAELQLKLHNLKEQKKHSQALRRAAAMAEAQPATAALTPPPPASEPSPPAAASGSVWGVELPADAQDRLRFTISMMKIQRLFRGKLARARLRLVEKLKKDKEEQEREMRARIEKRQQKKKEQQQQQQQEDEKQEGKRQEQQQREKEEKSQLSEDKQQPSQPAAASAAPSLSLPLHLLQEGKEELRGSLTSRLRHERQQQLQQQAEAVVKETRSIEVQVDSEELRETAALHSIPSAALRVELSDQSSLPFVADSQLLDQHLQLIAALSALPVPAAASAAAVRLETMGDGAEGGDFVLSSPLLGLQYLSSALYSRVFDGWREEGEGDDWESIIHLPLPAV